MKIVVLMTVYNRYDKTSRCLASLLSGERSGLIHKIILVDSGTDNTGNILANRYSVVESVGAEDDMYWAEGMRLAWDSAQKYDYDAVMWLNDDVTLYDDWFLRILGNRPLNGTTVYVGMCLDPVNRAPSYGGFNRGRFFTRLAFRPVFSDGLPLRCDTMNGNVVLVCRDVDRKLRGFPAGFRHNLADIVYGLRATRYGFDVVLAAEPVGECVRDHGSPKWLDPQRSRLERLRQALDVKAHPAKQWFRFCAEFGGISFPLYFLRPYIKAVIATGADTDATKVGVDG